MIMIKKNNIKNFLRILIIELRWKKNKLLPNPILNIF
jgi:hypothetical protein